MTWRPLNDAHFPSKPTEPRLVSEMGRTVAIIQARMGSERLPGKVLLDIVGQTMLERVVRRVQQSSLIDEVVVATTRQADDDAIVKECRALGVSVVRGSAHDVLDRYRDAALDSGASTCVRVCADSPLVDPTLCDLVVWSLNETNPPADYAGNKIDPSFPLGLDVEAFSLDALEHTWTAARNAYERAHVTVYMYSNPEEFRLIRVSTDVDRHSWRWTVDMPEDLEFVRQVYSRLDGTNDFTTDDVIDLIEREPDLALINAHLQPKAVTAG